MSLKQYLTYMSIGTVLCWLAWCFVLWNINPEQTDALGLAFFYITLLLAFVGTFSVAGLLARRTMYVSDEAAVKQVRQTFRQGIIFGFFAVALLFLASRDLASLWIVLLFALILAGIEGAVLAARKYDNA